MMDLAGMTTTEDHGTSFVASGATELLWRSGGSHTVVK
jgi:hypothetical protein